jgi:hypothetical protein
MPLVDGFNISEDHSVFSISKSFRHVNFWILGILGFPHVVDVLAALVQITNIHSLRFKELLESIAPLLNGLFNFERVYSSG